MTMNLEQALVMALEDELEARATYRRVIEEFGPVRPFSNIVKSEERHIEALRSLCRKFEVRPPVDRWLGQMEPPSSLLAACRDAIEVERENTALYERLIEAARDHPDVRETFERLQAASQENHLPAFERCLAREENEVGRSPAGKRHRHRARTRHRGGAGGCGG